MKVDTADIPLVPASARKPVFLWGMPGSGKSTALKWLCSRLDIRGVDTDLMIAEAFGDTIPALIRRHGWTWFRQEEHRLLKELLTEPPRLIATGGGTPCHLGNDALMLAAGEVVYLHAPQQILIRRLRSSAEERPLLLQQEQDLGLAINQLLDQREPVYRQAHWIFITDQDKAWLPALAGWIMIR